MISRRSFCSALGLGSAALASRSLFADNNTGSTPANGNKTIDKSLSVFLSDTHVPDATNGISYQEEKFALAVNEILAMNPLPANVVIFGDQAYHFGPVTDYNRSLPYINKLAAAGITVTMGMGNHDRRDNFAKVFPEYAKKTLLKGRMIFKADLGTADLLMLDSLVETPPEQKNKYNVAGGLDDAQQDWLADYLTKLTRPTFVCAHHDINEIKIHGEGFRKFLLQNDKVVGYIHGHHHFWRKAIISDSKIGPAIKKTLCLPSTGHWGDIGYVIFKTSADQAQAKLVQKEYFMPRPSNNPPKAWASIASDNNGETCTFDF